MRYLKYKSYGTQREPHSPNFYVAFEIYSQEEKKILGFSGSLQDHIGIAFQTLI